MLTLYHYWSSVCSQKARFCLAEKGLEWRSRHIDLFTFDHWQPDYLALNPKAVVPTLDHDGNVVIESNVIVEYLDDAFPAPSLSLADVLAKARMRLWLYDSEAIAHPNVNTASYNPRHAPRLARFSTEELIETASRHPNRDARIRMTRRAEPSTASRPRRRTRPTPISRICSTGWRRRWRRGSGFSAPASRSPTSPWRLTSTASRC